MKSVACTRCPKTRWRQSSPLNPRHWIIVRTQFLPEADVLRNLGADEVIPEEFETSVEFFSRMLKKYLIPRGNGGGRYPGYPGRYLPRSEGSNDDRDQPARSPDKPP